jgi:hypothetical protein
MLEAANVGLCRGPAWLNERVRIVSTPSSVSARRPSCSCASLLIAYGLDGASGASSVIGVGDGA